MLAVKKQRSTHFMDRLQKGKTTCTISGLDDTETKKIIDILAANQLDSIGVLAYELKEITLFHKALATHFLYRPFDACGKCQKPFTAEKSPKRCSSCKHYRYCSALCQKNHRKIHKPFCITIRHTNDQRNQKLKQHIQGNGVSIFKSMKANVLDKQCGGESNKYFEILMGLIAPWIKKSSEEQQRFWGLSLPTLLNCMDQRRSKSLWFLFWIFVHHLFWLMKLNSGRSCRIMSIHIGRKGTIHTNPCSLCCVQMPRQSWRAKIYWENWWNWLYLGAMNPKREESKLFAIFLCSTSFLSPLPLPRLPQMTTK